MSLWCAHRWKPRKATHVSLYSELATKRPDLPSEFKTEVLYVCERCGKAKVKDVKGHWTMEELTA